MDRGLKVTLVGVAVGLLFFLVASIAFFPRGEKVWTYDIPMPESFSETTQVQKAFMALAWFEGNAEECSQWTFFEKNLRYSHVVPRIYYPNSQRVKIHYLGQEEEVIFYTAKFIAWQEAYKTKSVLLEKGSLHVTVVPSFSEYVCLLAFLAIAGAVVGGVAAWAYWILILPHEDE